MPTHKPSRTLSAKASRRGSALTLALIVVMMVGLAGAAYLQVASALTRRQTSEVENLRAFYLAEAGLAEAFHAVRMGRTGQIGSPATPASFGDGLLWVEATTTGDDEVRLESTAMSGAGRATLQLVVEPVEVPLGFFSDEDLVVESVLLLDGFNSEEATYEETLPAPAPDPILLAPTDDKRELREWEAINGMDATTGSTADSGGSAEPATSPESSFEAHTGAGGLLSSNGDISFTAPSGDPVEIWGDVMPGPAGTVSGMSGVLVSGDSSPRSTAIELPTVAVPDIAMAPATRHDGLLPMLVSSGTSGHESITVAPDAELILRGPATVVIGSLVLEPGALLTLDTRDGNVELYVTGGGMDLQAGSVVTTSSDLPGELSVQVDAIPTLGAPPVNLDAASQFHGTIYAPETEVYVGSDFEVFGGIVARKLQLGSGAQLHFDNRGFEGSAIPRIVSWRIVEVAEAARSRRDPFRVLGVQQVDLEPLAEAHDLASVDLSIEYVDQVGIARVFSGTEDQFDWDLVAEVVKIERDPTRLTKDDASTAGGEDPADKPSTAEQELLELLQDPTLTSIEVSRDLIAAGPVTDTVLLEAIRSGKMESWDLYNVLKDSGPTASGYPGARGDGPLPDALLLELIASDYDSKALSWTLEHNSPLSTSTLEAARNRQPAMKPGDLNYVERAQP